MRNRFPSPGPPEIHLAPDGDTVIGYCPFDGNVWWLDVTRMRVSAEVTTRIDNPFWGSPAFSGDGRLLYLYDSWDGWVSVVDVPQRRLVRSSPIGLPAAAIRLPFVDDAANARLQRLWRLLVHECGGVGDGLQTVDGDRFPGHLADPVRARCDALQRTIDLFESFAIEFHVLDRLLTVAEQAGFVPLIADSFLVAHGSLDVLGALRDARLDGGSFSLQSLPKALKVLVP